MTDTYLSLWKGEVRKRELMADVLREIAEKYDLRVHDLVGSARHQPLARIRQEAMWECRQRTPHSLPEIGRRLGGRDHSTVLWGIRQHAKRLAETTPDRGAEPDLGAA